MVLFTHLKIILLQCFRFSVFSFSKISSIQTYLRGGKNFHVIFVDDHSRFTKFYLLRTKDEALEMFIKYKNKVENQKNKRIKRLRTDRAGGEYESNSFKEFCKQNGIIH